MAEAGELQAGKNKTKARVEAEVYTAGKNRKDDGVKKAKEAGKNRKAEEEAGKNRKAEEVTTEEFEAGKNKKAGEVKKAEEPEVKREEAWKKVGNGHQTGEKLSGVVSTCLLIAFFVSS